MKQRKIWSFLILSFGMLIATGSLQGCFAQTSEGEKGEQQTLSGKLIEKPWTKSTESYCAQGSDYFVLQVEGANHVLSANRGMKKKLKKKAGKLVKLTGKFETRTISFSDDPNLQHPTSGGEYDTGSFSCTVFKVSKVK